MKVDPRCLTCVLGFALAVSGTGRACAQTTAVGWRTDLAPALADAKAQQRLVLVCVNLDGEAANERALQMYQSKEFLAATANVVCVLGSTDRHQPGDGACPRFLSCTCSAHLACEKQIRRHFFGATDATLAAQHLLLYSDGLVAWHALYDVVPADILGAITAAESAKSQPLDQRLRAQRIQLAALNTKITKGQPAAYLQAHAMLVQTPIAHFCDGLRTLRRDVAERVVRDLPGHEREPALTFLDAAAKHPNKLLHDLALRLTAEVRARPPEPEPVAVAVVPTATAAPKGPHPLSEPLAVLGPADDLARVQWADTEQTLEGCRDKITVLWFFLPDAADLAGTVANMNTFATENRARGIETVGLAAATRVGDAVAKVKALGCRFPVGVYVMASGAQPFGVERFPAWVVLDPDTNMVFRTPQDGSSYLLDAGRELALCMALTPTYARRLRAPASGK